MPAAQPPRLLAVVGPTASGKTALGLNLAQHYQGAVISADSRQVYAGMNIGTAKSPQAWAHEAHSPQQADIVEGIPHYLFNVCAPDTRYTLATWKADATHVIDRLHAAQIPALLVGGTMLYIDSVMFGYELPPVPPNDHFRQTLIAQDTDALYRELLTRDPAATFVEPHNKRRIIRALEVMEATGKPFSQLRRQRVPPSPDCWLGLFPGWEQLRDNVTRRVEEMLDAGLVEEVARLVEYYGEALPLLQTLNYKQGLALLQGQISREAAAMSMIAATMRYAHRQMSWWKNNKQIHWLTGIEALHLKSLD
ncbi:MAG: tRNA (adenosine(37)-N6)-dimethylallyltransferase MiaA [Candidatus Andersenbacteria bacterium]